MNQMILLRTLGISVALVLGLGAASASTEMLPTPAAADEEIRLLAQSDIRLALANRARFEAPLVAAYVRATPEGKSLLLEATQIADPKFSAMLRQR